MKKGNLLILLMLVMLLSACGRTARMPSEVIGELLACRPLPAGAVYSTEVGAGSRDFLSPSLLLSLFGHCEEEMGLVEQGCVYLSAREEVCEAYVFLCYAPSGTEPVCELLAGRADALKRSMPALSAKTVVMGRYVLFALGEDAESVVDGLRHGLRG